MTVELYYKYSVLEKRKEFGIVFTDDRFYEQYIRWVWFYLGHHGMKNVSIYPYNIHRVESKNPYKVYKNCNDAERQAKQIVNAINKMI